MNASRELFAHGRCSLLHVVHFCHDADLSIDLHMSRRSRTKRSSPAPPSRAARARAGQAWLLGLLIVAALALIARFWHLHQISRAPFHDLLLGDAAAYDAWARTIAAGNWIGDKIFYQAPLYPYFLATLYGSIGRSVAAVKYVQAVMGALSCVLIADATRRLFSRRAGLVAGVLLALYPPAIFLETLIQKSALDEVLLCLLLWLIAREIERARRWSAVFVGLVIGALILNRENASLLVVPLAAWVATRPNQSPARQALVFLGAVAIVLAPVAIRNRIVGGEWAVTTAQFGPNFYIGNNRDADGTYRPLIPWRGNAAFEQSDANALAERELGRTLTAGEVSAFYRNRVLEFIRSEPRRWAGLLARKAFLTFNAVEIPDTEDQYTYARWSWLLRLDAIWNFATLFGVALAGAWFIRGKWTRVWIVFAIVAFYAASLVLFYVFARYRFILVPPLIVLAGFALSEAAAFLRGGSRTQIVACGMIVAVVAIACGRRMVPTSRLEALMRFNTGVGLQSHGRLDEAIAEFRAAAALYPALPQVHYDLGIALRDSGRLPEAIAELREAVRWAPRDPRALNNLGVALGQAGTAGEAVQCFRAALAVDPNLAEARGNLAEWYAAHGRLDEAATEAEKAIQLEPSLLAAWKTLTRIRGQQRLPSEALAAAQAASNLAPDDPTVLNALGIALAELGRRQDAVSAFQRALERDPGNAAIRRNLMRLQAPPI